MMLGSNMTQQMKNVETGDLMSVCMNCAWKTDPDYSSFPVESKAWFEEAAKIAEEYGRNEIEVSECCVYRVLKDT